jgi:phosphatidate phosphatase PAH1
VRISVNGKEIQQISMVIDGEGEAFFVRQEVNIDCKSCGHHEVEQVAEVKPSGPKSANNLTITHEPIVP